MERKTTDGSWNPYLAGALVGILAIVSAYLTTLWMDKTNFLGASTTFVRGAGFLEQWFSPEYVAENAYFNKERIVFDWQFLLVIGIFFGSLISSLSDKSFKLEKVPPTWEARFGTSVLKRAFWAFIGGTLAMMGARMADGCPSGHGLSGIMQLSVSSLLATALFFIAGIIVANIIYRSKS